MTRKIAAIVAGLLLWVALGSLLILALRLAWPAYEAVHVTKTFTLPMLLTRLTIGALASLAMGATVRRIAGPGGRAVLACGVLFLLLNLPIHLLPPVWNQYPGWYHLIYLGYLVPLTLLGGRLARRT
jgi:hypothetical protein